MRKTVRVLLPALCVLAGILAAGCYTQFATLEQKTVSPDRVVTVIDSTGKVVTVVQRADTVPTIDQETCIWERDLMGFPTLHCYKGYYPREWYLYNFSPWWYRTDEHLYSADRCPPFYYFDNSCGCCRYYLNNPDALRSSATRGDTARLVKTVPATGKAPADTQEKRVNITTGSRTTFYSGQHITQAPPGRPLPPGGPAPSTVTKQDTAAKKNDSASADAQQTSNSGQVDTAKPGTAGVTPAQNPRQDTIRVPPARPAIRRSLRER